VASSHRHCVSCDEQAFSSIVYFLADFDASSAALSTVTPRVVRFLGDQSSIFIYGTVSVQTVVLPDRFMVLSGSPGVLQSTVVRRH
jgi:hypothetical protein